MTDLLELSIVSPELATMAFGAGVLISAVSYELIFEAVTIGKGAGGPAVGLVLGALTFFCRQGDQQLGGRRPHRNR